jgi:sec-independent protein translocase protein TatA
MFTGLTSPTHLIILLVIILLLFGAKRLPELGRSLGQGIKEFRAGLNTKEASEEQHHVAVEEGERHSSAKATRDGSEKKEAAT